MEMLLYAMQAWLVGGYLWLEPRAEWRLDAPADPPPKSTPALLCCLTPLPLPLACKKTMNETHILMMRELR